MPIRKSAKAKKKSSKKIDLELEEAGVIDEIDSESETLDREIVEEKQKIIDIKKRRLAKLKCETERVTREEESEDEFFHKDTRENQKLHRSARKKAKSSGGSTEKSQTGANDKSQTGMNIDIARNLANIEDLKEN